MLKNIFFVINVFFIFQISFLFGVNKQEFHNWVDKAVRQSHFTQGNAKWLHDKFNQYFDQKQPIQVSKDKFIAWVLRAKQDGHFTEGNVKYILKKINQIQAKSAVPSVVCLQQIATTQNFIHFYLHGTTSFLGNFAAGKEMHYNGLTADNVETLFQAQKFLGTPEYQHFHKLTAEQAFELKKELEKKYQSPPNWHIGEKDRVMQELLVLKFSDKTNQDLLMATGNAYLVEHNERKGRDEYWSDDHDGTGQNMLGIYLMDLRGKLGGTGIVGRPIEYDNALRLNDFPVL